MKKRYEVPELTTVKFDTGDIITVSGVGADIDGGSTEFPGSWDTVLSEKQLDIMQ